MIGSTLLPCSGASFCRDLQAHFCHEWERPSAMDAKGAPNIGALFCRMLAVHLPCCEGQNVIFCCFTGDKTSYSAVLLGTKRPILLFYRGQNVLFCCFTGDKVSYSAVLPGTKCPILQAPMRRLHTHRRRLRSQIRHFRLRRQLRDAKRLRLGGRWCCSGAHPATRRRWRRHLAPPSLTSSARRRSTPSRPSQ
jgi:hypothetical protein